MEADRSSAVKARADGEYQQVPVDN